MERAFLYRPCTGSTPHPPGTPGQSNTAKIEEIKNPAFLSLHFPSLLCLALSNCPWVSEDTRYSAMKPSLDLIMLPAVCLDMCLCVQNINLNFLSSQIHFTTKRARCSETCKRIDDYIIIHSLILCHRLHPQNFIYVTT